MQNPESHTTEEGQGSRMSNGRGRDERWRGHMGSRRVLEPRVRVFFINYYVGADVDRGGVQWHQNGHHHHPQGLETRSRAPGKFFSLFFFSFFTNYYIGATVATPHHTLRRHVTTLTTILMPRQRVKTDALTCATLCRRRRARTSLVRVPWAIFYPSRQKWGHATGSR